MLRKSAATSEVPHIDAMGYGEQSRTELEAGAFDMLHRNFETHPIPHRQKIHHTPSSQRAIRFSHQQNPALSRSLRQGFDARTFGVTDENQMYVVERIAFAQA